MSTIYIGVEYECHECTVAAFFRKKADAIEWADKEGNRTLLAFKDKEGELTPDKVFWRGTFGAAPNATNEYQCVGPYSETKGGARRLVAEVVDKQLKKRKDDDEWHKKLLRGAKEQREYERRKR